MLPDAQTKALIDSAQHGDLNAKAVLLQENVPLIKSIVKKYRNRGVEYEDLFQLGAMGFVKAVNNFDLSYDVRFSTYAVPMILGEIKRFLRDDGYVKVSRSVKATGAKINRFIEVYRSDHQTEPTVSEIAAALQLDAQEVVFAMEASRSPLSLYEHEEDDGEKSLGLIDRLSAKERFDLSELLTLKALINELPPREKKIILLRYFRDRTQSEIALELGVSQVQISRLESKIIKKLKEKMTEA